MAQKMRIDDEIRLNILTALIEKGSTQANIRRIQNKTDYHQNRSKKNSLSFAGNAQIS